MKTIYSKVNIVLAVLFNLTLLSTASAQKTNARLHQLFDSYYRENLQFDPITETFLGDHQFDGQVANNISAPYLKKKYAFDRKYLRLLKTFDLKKLGIDDQISYGYLKELLTDDLQRSAHHFEYMPFTQFVSTPVDVGTLGQGNSAQPFDTPEQYLIWLKRVDQFIIWMDTARANMKKGIATGNVLPKVLVLKIIPQLETLGNSDTSKNLFFNPVRHFPASFTEDQKTMLKMKFDAVIGGRLLPCYSSFASFLKNEYLPHAQDHPGLNAIPEGPGMYRVYMRLYTTTDKSPEELYQVGLNEVARITRKMEELKSQFTFEGTLQGFLTYLRTDRRFMPFKTPEEVLQSYRNIYDKIKPHLRELFDVSPKGQFDIKRVEAFREAAANGPSYMTGSLSDNRPGTFYVPVVDAAKINVTFLGMEATFLHEAIPGHHYQMALQSENARLPDFRKQVNFPVFTEGWAFYVETLGKQLGCYADPAQQMGALNNDMQRALRLVIDIGIHMGKMSEQQAIEFMMRHESISEDDAALSVERYMGFPGQALSYKTGQLEIIRLKQQYQKILGSKFDIVRFHHALLTKGDMPLSVLDSYMAEWAREQNSNVK